MKRRVILTNAFSHKYRIVINEVNFAGTRFVAQMHCGQPTIIQVYIKNNITFHCVDIMYSVTHRLARISVNIWRGS